MCVTSITQVSNLVIQRKYTVHYTVRLNPINSWSTISLESETLLFIIDFNELYHVAFLKSCMFLITWRVLCLRFRLSKAQTRVGFGASQHVGRTVNGCLCWPDVCWLRRCPTLWREAVGVNGVFCSRLAAAQLTLEKQWAADSSDIHCTVHSLNVNVCS